MYDFERIFAEIAPMGRFQMLYVFVYTGFWTIRAMSTVSIIMIAATPDFKCGEQNETSKCYTPNISDANNVDSDVCTGGNITTCSNGYVYDCSTWQNTATMEWDLICDRRTLHSVATFMYFLGAFFSSFVGGMISDKIGRKPVMILGALFCAVCNFSVAMVPNMTWFCIVRFLVPIFGFASVMASFNYVVEVTSKEWRILVGIHSNSVFGLGIVLIAPLSYFVRDWRMLQISISLLLLPFCLAFCWFPESPRWLYAYNRVDECNKVLNRIAKFNNRKPIDPEEWEKFKGDESSKQHEGNDEWISPITMIRNYPTVSKITCIMMFEWFAICLVYYGLTLNAGSLAGNIFINTALIGLMDFLGCVICHPLVKRFGCRKSLLVFMAIAGITCLLSMLAIHKDPVLQKMGVVSAMIGKFTISGTFAIVYLYVAEIFPTDIRTTTLGTSSAIARVGSMISPFALQLQQSVPWLPQTLFGILSLVGALLVIYLPETHRKPILTSSEEAEQKYKFRKSPKTEKNILVH